MEFNVVFTEIWCSSPHAAETSCKVVSFESINKTSNKNVGTDVKYGLTMSSGKKLHIWDCSKVNLTMS
jgi:hypothetical protein